MTHSRAMMVLVGFAALGACRHKTDRRVSPGYSVGNPGEGWKAQSPGSADHAWYHPEIFGTIYTSANCGKRYEDGRLEDLATHLTFGIASGLPTRDEMLRLDNRDALVRIWDGNIDGVAVKVGAVVTKKNDCLYDLLYFAPPTTFDAGWPAFRNVVDGFQARRS